MRARGWNQCEVDGCSNDGRKALYEADGGRWRLCETHHHQAALAVEEVMGHLLETGETYLPGTGETVVVEYQIEDSDDSERAFRIWRGSPTPSDTRGLIGETLYRVQWDGEDNSSSRRFVNIGHWRSVADFDKKFETKRDVLPAMAEFETVRRRRGWLTKV